MMHLYLIGLALTLTSATPINSPDQSPTIDMSKVILKRTRECSQVRCANLGGAEPIKRPECTWFNCGLCTTSGYCFPDPGNSDSYNPDKPGNPYGGADGGAGNGAGSDDSSGTCNGSDTQDDTGSCPANDNSGGGGSGTVGESRPYKAASCWGSCSTSDYGACGSGCGCTFAGTGTFGGLDGTCIALVSFAGSG